MSNFNDRNVTIDSSITDWIIEFPESYQFFLSIGVNTGCSGTSLAYELERKGLNPEHVLKELLSVLEKKSST